MVGCCYEFDSEEMAISAVDSSMLTKDNKNYSAMNFTFISTTYYGTSLNT